MKPGTGSSATHRKSLEGRPKRRRSKIPAQETAIYEESNSDITGDSLPSLVHRNSESATTEPSRRTSYEWGWSSDQLSQPLLIQPHLTPEPISPVEGQWLHTIYEGAFETIFGSWMGRYSNPFAFGEQSLSDVISIRRVCSQLDRHIDEEDAVSGTISDAGASPDLARHEKDTQLNQFLDHAIQSFAARWLPLTHQLILPGLSQANVVCRLWRRAHTDMLKVINRPSYRSMLTLLLFALTPIPVGISEEEELEGVSGQVCVHAALQQIQTLRARQKSLQFNGTRVNLTNSNRPIGASPASLATANFIIAESTAYWAALTFDTSASLTLNCRPLLSSGLFGFESEPSWRMVRTCIGIFRETTRDWSNADVDLTDEKANQVIAAGAAWKLLVWKLTANLKESLRDGHDEAEVLRAFNSVSSTIDQFNITYRDLLIACQRRIQFFNQETRLRWYELMLHYNLAILMVTDIATATLREDLLSLFSAKRVDAETWVMNCLVFGLNNKYTLKLQPEPALSDPEIAPSQSASLTVPLIAIDPYPHHVVAAVKLMQHAIDRDFGADKISADAYNNLRSTLKQTLEQLPQVSKSVQTTRAEFERAESPPQPLYP
ncbi:uncharacterized protein Z519_11767 [Cladophialophora bantiana CBS 173.52]|uniref:Transcription factor domain-containing protein n=1 Tax=Cladophialophora bantiana (strain ATCC 10958 / CBS 173.52 / CDC B-1940 / NIH 8579) TaxID=1442370 RepID=A0A0D2H393_CLAB1|nr:uncharacterized protein Z519_11767 [Cladophialophora bantiana CBS 173.52]KIW87793.1 hypothetical protein Z519_11767 [Cladophialophora bantiana CBS 173.52]